MGALAGEGHAARMDRQYAFQRHIYDLTRKYYLLGRDRVLCSLDAPAGGCVLEIGCGTGRNLALAARHYPDARLFGLDISAQMLKNARHNAPSSRLARGDATSFDAEALLGVTQFDRIFMSYALSMIPQWETALAQAASLLAPGGSLHIVDFGQQEGLPRVIAAIMFSWLARFHVMPRRRLFEEAARLAAARDLHLATARLYRGYAWSVVLTRA